MMKFKYNKKRNTAFLFEALVMNYCKSILDDDEKQKKIINRALKEYFSINSPLRKELEFYQTFDDVSGLEKEDKEKLLETVKIQYAKLDQNLLFKEQGKLISFINKNIGKNSLNIFSSNYKYLANLDQVLKQTQNPKTLVLLEKEVLKNKVTKIKVTEKKIDDIEYKVFVNKFNEKYNKLLKEQKELLHNFIMFPLSSTEFKFYMNETISDLKVQINDLIKSDEVKNDKELKEKSSKILKMLNNFSLMPLDEDVVKMVLMTQELIGEYKNNEENPD